MRAKWETKWGTKWDDKRATAAALAAFRDNPDAAGWRALPFFADGTAERIATQVDACIAAGKEVLPAPEAIFNALLLTPLDAVKVVILGQDPYPTPGDAHGLAFSYVGRRRLPASLKAILAEMAEDLRRAARNGRSQPVGAARRAPPQHSADDRGRLRWRPSEARLVGPDRSGGGGGVGRAPGRRLPAVGRAGAPPRRACRPGEAPRPRGRPPLAPQPPARLRRHPPVLARQRLARGARRGADRFGG